MPDILGARTHIAYASEAYSVTAADALVPITSFVRGTAAAVTTQPVVTTAKVMRIQSIDITGVLLGTTVANTTVRLRANLTGAATVTSPIVKSWRLGNHSVGTQAANYGLFPITIPFTEGLEFPAGAGFQFTAISSTAAMHSITISLYGFEYTA